jgi:hypothetical protein
VVVDIFKIKFKFKYIDSMTKVRDGKEELHKTHLKNLNGIG